MARALLNIVLTGIFLTFVGMTLAVAVESANREADVDRVSREARELYAGFEKYYARHGEYPNAYTRRSLDIETLDPLYNRGYYRGVLLAKVRNHRADAYDSPDDEAPNKEFWIEFTLASDPSIRILVAKSDDAPLSGGRWKEGAYLYRDGELKPL